MDATVLWPTLETLGVVTLAAMGACGGLWFSRLPKPYWSLGYFVPFCIVLMIGATRRNSVMEFVPPFSWLVAGRTEFALTAPVVTMLLSTPLSRLSRKGDRRAVLALMTVVVFVIAVWPFLAPAFNRKHLVSLRTNIDSEGICHQSNQYNCGPAAAVTGLRRLGFAAEEGEIAILAHTSTAIGTPADILAAALREKYGSQGLICEYRHFKSVFELTNAPITLAVIKFALMLDHYVTILDVTSDHVIVGDPLVGKTSYTHADFAKRWRFNGVILKRKSAGAERG